MKEGGKDRLGFTLPTDHMQIACKASTAATKQLMGVSSFEHCDFSHISDTVTGLEGQSP